MGKTYKNNNKVPKIKPKSARNETKVALKTAITDKSRNKLAYDEIDYPEDNFEKFDRKR